MFPTSKGPDVLSRVSKQSGNNAGFTLIEIMIVISIIAATLAIGGQKMFDSSTTQRSAVRKLGILTREIRNVARLTNQTSRLVIQMDDQKGHTYSVESAPGTAMLLTEDQKKDLDSLTELQREDDKKKETFQPDTRLVKSPIQLPRGLFFESVEFSNTKEPITKGKAYIHYFPSGLSENAAIHITNRKTLNWTITIHPLTGRAEVYERKATLKELQP